MLDPVMIWCARWYSWWWFQCSCCWDAADDVRKNRKMVVSELWYLWHWWPWWHWWHILMYSMSIHRAWSLWKNIFYPVMNPKTQDTNKHRVQSPSRNSDKSTKNLEISRQMMKSKNPMMCVVWWLGQKWSTCTVDS